MEEDDDDDILLLIRIKLNVMTEALATYHARECTRYIFTYFICGNHMR